MLYFSKELIQLTNTFVTKGIYLLETNSLRLDDKILKKAIVCYKQLTSLLFSWESLWNNHEFLIYKLLLVINKKNVRKYF